MGTRLPKAQQSRIARPGSARKGSKTAHGTVWSRSVFRYGFISHVRKRSSVQLTMCVAIQEPVGPNTTGGYPHDETQQAVAGPVAGNGATPADHRHQYGGAQQQGQGGAPGPYQTGPYAAVGQRTEALNGPTHDAGNPRPRRRRRQNRQAAATEPSHTLATWARQDPQLDPWTGPRNAAADPNAGDAPVFQTWDGPYNGFN